MKKAAAFICAFWILLASCHINFYVHYCCGKVSDITLSTAKESCPKCSKKGSNTCHITKKTCCEQVVKVVKADNSIKGSPDIHILKTTPALLPVPLLYTHPIFISKAHVALRYANAPPTLHKRPFYLLHRSLII